MIYKENLLFPEYRGCPCPLNACPKNVLIGPATGKAPAGGGPDVPSALAPPGGAFRSKVRACALDAVPDTHGSGKVSHRVRQIPILYNKSRRLANRQNKPLLQTLYAVQDIHDSGNVRHSHGLYELSIFSHWRRRLQQSERTNPFYKTFDEFPSRFLQKERKRHHQPNLATKQLAWFL